MGKSSGQVSSLSEQLCAQGEQQKPFPVSLFCLWAESWLQIQVVLIA